MPVPSHRRSRSRVRSRRAHDAMKAVNLGVCSACHAPVMPHRACPSCGLYNGRKVIDLGRKATRLLKKGGSPASDPHAGHKHE